MTTHRMPLLIAPDHPAFAGHFPGAPIVPGVVLLDEALHAIGTLAGTDLSACQISSVKFFSPVRPGEPLQVQVDMLNNGAIRFDIVRDEPKDAGKVATGSIRMPAAE